MAGDELVVSMDEFAELAGVTPETMRVHLKEMLRDVTAEPAWLIERGDRGRAYKIEAERGLRWWQEKREADLLADETRRGKIQQLRLDVLGSSAEQEDALKLSGRARREEYAAAMDAVKYRKMLKNLVEKVELERVLSAAAVELRRRLRQIAPEFGIVAGLEPDQVRKLDATIERAVEAFVTTITKADAFEGDV